MRQVVLDTETTGLEIELGHRIIEVGCIELINRKLTGKRFHRYINPGRQIEVGAHAVHGITAEFLQDKPMFGDIVHELMDFILGSELIIHNAPFDVGFLDYELKICNTKWTSVTHHCKIVDSLIIARQLHVGQRNSLDALCKRYSVDNSRREFHGALLDAHLLAQVYLSMTGGQSSLFDEQSKVETQAFGNVDQDVISKIYNLIVIPPTADESRAHEEKLQAMQKKGRCLWTELLS
jgi:DNA polymerase-3 subunit epsilon